MRHLTSILFLFLGNFLAAQSVNIFVSSSWSGFPDPTALTSAYTAAGFSSVNITNGTVGPTLTTGNFDVAIIVEYYQYNSGSYNPVFLSGAQVTAVENFISSGGQVVWIAESWDTSPINNMPIASNLNAISTINNLYGTTVSYGTYFNNSGAGSNSMPRIHPSNGPGGLSASASLESSGSYATLSNVPVFNKVYAPNFFDNITFFDPCISTTVALFPAKPVSGDGTVLLSSELGNPFSGYTIWGPMPPPPPVFNTTFDNAIAQLHYRLLTGASMTAINAWDNIPSNVNCAPLSVEDAQFEVFMENGQVELTWKAASEAQGQKYQVERLHDDHGQIIVERACGQAMYRADDPFPIRGTSLYKLSLLNKDGSLIPLGAKVLEMDSGEISESLKFEQQGEYLVFHSKLGALADYILMDVQGRDLRPGLAPVIHTDHELWLPMSFLSNGLYILSTPVDCIKFRVSN